MAVQGYEALAQMSEKSVDFARSIFERGEGPGGSPYMDARAFAGLFNANMDSAVHMVYGEISADADGAAEGIDVEVGFSPKMVALFNETQTELIIKMKSMPGLYAMKLTGVPAFAYANTLLTLGNKAADDDKFFHYDAAEITLADKIHFIALG